MCALLNQFRLTSHLLLMERAEISNYGSPLVERLSMPSLAWKTLCLHFLAASPLYPAIWLAILTHWPSSKTFLNALLAFTYWGPRIMCIGFVLANYLFCESRICLLWYLTLKWWEVHLGTLAESWAPVNLMIWL